MTITSDQIVLSESEVMADTEDGGGRMSGRIVVSGQINNTFPDISRVDRVYGRVNLRKLYLYINAANQDTLLGAHTILSQRPADPNVHALLFSTGSHTDRRIDAQDRIESYVVASSEAQFWLWGRQLKGQRAIQCLAWTHAAKTPEPGQIFVLSDLNSGAEQYVRLTSVETANQVFVKQLGSSYHRYTLRTYVLELSQPLRYEFNGSEPDPTGNINKNLKILQTQVADAAKYMGASPLVEPAAVGDRTIRVASTYAPLVPSAQSENPIVDQPAGAGAAIIRPASHDTYTITNVRNVTTDSTGAGVYYTGRSIVPGTLKITGGNGNYEDRGGALNHTGGQARLNAEESVVDYINGQVRAVYASGGSASQYVTIEFQPGAVVNQQTKQASLEVNQQTRSLTWVFQTEPAAAPATLTVEYRAQGNWYLLRDQGAGELVGDGTGTINYVTGTVNYTLAALPDADTHIILAWGEEQGTVIEVGATVPDRPTVVLEVGETVTE